MSNETKNPFKPSKDEWWSESSVCITREDWDAYRRVQKSGEYNMYDPNARMLTGIERNPYIEILRNYSDLKEWFESEVK